MMNYTLTSFARKNRFIVYLVMTLQLSSCGGNSEDGGEHDPNPIDFQKELDVSENQFQISPKSDTLIFGESGTAIFIGANSFESANGQDLDRIDIVLKEYYDLSDMLIQDLSTEAVGGFLETGGMIHIKATSDGKKVFLKQGEELIVHFPKNGNTAEMQLFTQSYEDSPRNTVRWKVEKAQGGHEIDTLTPFIIKYDDLDSDYMLLQDGTNIWDWLAEEISLTDAERDYVRLRDFNIEYLITKSGEVTEVQLEKGYDEKRCNRLLSIIEKMPDIKPFTRGGKVTDMEGWTNFAVKYIPPKHLSNEAYLKEIENKYPNFEKMSINDLDQVELNYYIFNTAKLGWLNCDRFVDDPSPKVNMTLKLDAPEDLMIKFVYKDLKSIITPRFENGVNHFNGIPAGKDITLVIIKSGKKNVQMSITEHITAEGELKGISFKDYTMEELKTELQKLN